jgi:hypothetical protein
LLVQQWRGATASAKVALSIAQVRVDKVQANRQCWTATLFAVVGFALGLRGLLDREAIGKVLERVHCPAATGSSARTASGVGCLTYVRFERAGARTRPRSYQHCSHSQASGWVKAASTADA